jgi:hypothetical protein
MAKTLARQYVFTPGAANVGTIVVPGRIALEQLLVITNTTKNVIIYNFADATYAGTTVTFTPGNTAAFPSIDQRVDGYTTITLAYNTAAHSASDKIQVLFEETQNGVTIRPWAFGTDAIERMRVSTPQSMIDADFEYGLQPTKWAGYGLMRGYPSIYEFTSIDLTATAVTTNFTTTSTTNSLITVTTSAAHGITAGQAVNMTGLSSAITGFSRAGGSFIVFDVPTSTTLRYFANGVVGTANGQSLFTDTTLIKRAALYTGASLATTTATSNAASPSVITVNFASNHGLIPGCPIYVTIPGGTNATLATGPFLVESVPSLTSIRYTARPGGAVSPTGTPIVYAMSNSSILHRPVDGGVILSCETPSFGASTIRVSKKYFRYQSGKGLLWSTGTLFRPSYDIQSITASATGTSSTVTVRTDNIDHGLQVGATVTIAGVTTTGYNGTFTVASIVDDITFTYNSGANNIAATTGVMGISARVTVAGWHGGVVRAGTFDDQNGMFWEFNGSTLSVVRRNATQQLTGTVAINSNSNIVTGTNTRFTQQAKVGDKIVIRGMTHFVSQVSSNTAMTVTPDYRGTTNVTGVKASLVQDTRIPQSSFNIDKLDGTGPSGFTIDTGKMQMMGLQYTWYGAGFVDFMVRGSDGNWIFAHRMKNNNVNTEAYMRTGNLPVRYSIENEGNAALAFLTADPGTGGTTLTVNDTTYFPSAGTLYIDNELITYTGKTATTFTGCTRAATLTQYCLGATRSFTAGVAAAHAVSTGIILVSNTASPTLSHWGSAVICDGEFDTDRGYIFNYQRTALPITTTTTTAFLIRLAPSVSNSQIGDLGSRDLLNRSQLLLNAVGIQTYGASATPGSIIVEGVLNPGNFSNATWTPLNLTAAGGQPSLAQVATAVTYTSGTFATPGEQVFAFAATPNSDDRLDLSELKELTNAPIGGVGAYPNGPDILAVNVRIVSGTANASVLLRWGEAQA